MELKDFIQTAVTQIVEGVVAAQAAAAAHHVLVNPAVDLQRRNGTSPGGQAAAPRVSDISFDVASPQGAVEYTNRLYFGPGDVFAATWGSRGVFETFFFSPAAAGAWVLTGTVPRRVAEMISKRQGLSVRAGEGRFAAMLEQHRAHAAGAGAIALRVPAGLAEAAALYDDYVKTAID